MGGGKGRRGRGRGGRTPAPQGQGNSSAASGGEGEGINRPRNLVEEIDYAYIEFSMRQNHFDEHDVESDEINFPTLSASEAVEAAEAVVHMEDEQLPQLPSGNSSPEMDNDPEIISVPLQDDYILPIIHPDSPAANAAEPAAIVGVQVDEPNSAHMRPNKRIYCVGVNYFPEDSDDGSSSLEIVSVGESAPAGKVVGKAEAAETLDPNVQLDDQKPVLPVNPQRFGRRMYMTPQLHRPADLNRTQSPSSSVSTSGSRKRAGGSVAMASGLSDGPKKRRYRKTPPPPRTLLPRASKVIGKFTDVIKQKVIAYIKQVKKVKENEALSDPTDYSWITVFIQSAISANSDVTAEHVLIWIDHFPQIFTREAVRNLREHCNRLRQEEEADVIDLTNGESDSPEDDNLD